jgi:anti-sigma B factor antagonist
MLQSSTLTSPSVAKRFVAPEPFVCTWKRAVDGAAWVQIAGELDLATAPRLDRALQEAQGSALKVVLDMRELTFMDSSGIHVIQAADDRAQREGGRLMLVRGPPQVDRLFDLERNLRGGSRLDLDRSEPAESLLHLAGSCAA